MNQVKFYEASQNERREVAEIAKMVVSRKLHVVFAFLHGSFPSECSFRDIDVGVFVSTTDSSAYLDYEIDLSQQIEDALPSAFPVQVKVLNQALSSHEDFGLDIYV